MRDAVCISGSTKIVLGLFVRSVWCCVFLPLNCEKKFNFHLKKQLVVKLHGTIKMILIART